MTDTPPLTPKQGADGMHDVLKGVPKPLRGKTEPVGQIFRDKSGGLEAIGDPLGQQIVDVLKRVVPDKHGEAMDIYGKRSDATHSIHRKNGDGGTEITVEKKPSAFTLG